MHCPCTVLTSFAHRSRVVPAPSPLCLPLCSLRRSCTVDALFVPRSYVVHAPSARRLLVFCALFAHRSHTVPGCYIGDSPRFGQVFPLFFT
ncbi:hypothetical protein DEO72_LG10g2536 [Vigna unguiculata]|uniref:Uncharacterized protein n=1 Tax=Vigna unguiculata TaxID=3917 RepID=A0A4D6NBU4_VIGUN|nr:hypothetical protein DEO72_LG10g2536 [Vigna unguiculata]